MIATLKVLGLVARDFATIAGAANRIVKYLEGTGPPGSATMTSYYGRSARPSEGSARGAGAQLLGLLGSVSACQLQRLLEGRHAATGKPLLSSRGSAGRFQATLGEVRHSLVDAPAVMTLAQAAQLAKISPTYLRRLAEDFEGERAALERVESGLVTVETKVGTQWTLAEPVSARIDRHHLRAFRDPTRPRWLVAREELARFMLERQPPTVVLGYDLTCSAPKSVSLLWAFGDLALRDDVTAALEAGVDAAIDYLEQHAVVGTIGRRNQPGMGLGVASYRHEISRSEEAHLHLHNLIINAIAVPLVDDDGRPLLDEHGVARIEWRALDGELLLRHVKTAGYVGAAVLRHELVCRRGLSWGPLRNGVAEVEGFPPQLLEAFSTRHGEVTREFTEMIEAGLPADSRTMAAAQRESRATKRVLSDPQVEAIQRRKLADIGWSVDRVRALGVGRDRELSAPTSDEVAEFFDDLVGPRGLTEHRGEFGHREVVQAVAAWAGDRLNVEAILVVAQRFLTDPRIVLLASRRRRRRNEDEHTYTTIELLEVERSLVRLYRQGRVDRGGRPRVRVDPDLVEAAIEAVNDRLREESSDHAGGGLAEEQKDLVRTILSSRDLARVVVGPAGTGKTETMRAVVHAGTAAGHSIVATANGGRQTQDLNERLTVPARVVAGWLTLLTHAVDPSEVWPSGTMVIVDEATQVDTRDAQRLLHYATLTSTVLILIGDPVQMGSVGTGGWFRHLIDLTPDAPGLRVNQRQRGQQMAAVRQALAGLRQQSPESDQAALRRLAADGRVAVFANREDMLDAIVTDWYTDRHARTPKNGRREGLDHRSRMMAEHHRDTDLLNRAARERLTADGTLTGPALRVAGREFRAGDEVLTLTQSGHTLIPAGRPRGEYIRTGTVGVVTAVHLDPAHPDRQHLIVQFPGRGDVYVDWSYLTYPFPDGRDGGLAHAYAHTAHKAEGGTMTTARATVTDDTSRSGLYVMLSRARADLRAYVIRRTDLHADLEDEDWLPILDSSTGPLRAVLDRLADSGPESLTSEDDPIAQAAHALASSHTLADLTEHRRAAARALQHASSASTAERADAERELLITRRAEIAREVSTTSAALADPAPRLISRIGPRPTTGSHRAGWDGAVSALAVLHARHPLSGPPHELPAGPPTVDEDDVEKEWLRTRAAAEQIAGEWAGHLGEQRAHRFHSQEEVVPRQRAVTAIHALLAHGQTPDTVMSALTADPVEDVRTAAAVLDYRAARLLEAAGIDAAYYELPPAAPAGDEWRTAQQKLRAAEIHHLAGRRTGDLAAEARELTAVLTRTPDERDSDRHVARLNEYRTLALAAATRLQAGERHLAALRVRPAASRRSQDQAQREIDVTRQELAGLEHAVDLAEAWTTTPVPREYLQARWRLVHDALAQQVDHAALALRQEPTLYLIGLLGDRPLDEPGYRLWDQRAIAVEHYRHHILGLSYGTPAAPSSARSLEQALGRRPVEAHEREMYDRARDPQPTLDLGSEL